MRAKIFRVWFFGGPFSLPFGESRRVDFRVGLVWLGAFHAHPVGVLNGPLQNQLVQELVSAGNTSHSVQVFRDGNRFATLTSQLPVRSADISRRNNPVIVGAGH